MPLKLLQIPVIAMILVASPLVNAKERPDHVQAEIDAFARYLDSHPEMVIDLRKVSGEMCFNTWKVGGRHMTHYAVDPASTKEDVIDFVPADALSDVLDLEKLPRFPGELGAMVPNQWYYLPSGEREPHHGTRFPFPLLLRATNID